jgi:hypothetical protein
MKPRCPQTLSASAIGGRAGIDLSRYAWRCYLTGSLFITMPAKFGGG